MGYHVGQRVLDTLFVREKNFKREIRLINLLVFIKTNVWKALFGKEADKLEQANDDEATCMQLENLCRYVFSNLIFYSDYIIEKEPLVNKYISVPKDKGSLNCAAFIGGIIEAVLCESNFVSLFNQLIIFI